MKSSDPTHVPASNKASIGESNLTSLLAHLRDSGDDSPAEQELVDALTRAGLAHTEQRHADFDVKAGFKATHASARGAAPQLRHQRVITSNHAHAKAGTKQR